MLSRLNMLLQFSSSVRRLSQSSQMLTKQTILTNIDSGQFKKKTSTNLDQTKSETSINDQELINNKSNLKNTANQPEIKVNKNLKLI